MMTHINILTGSIFQIHNTKVGGTIPVFKHALWVLQDDYNMFQTHPILGDVKLKEGEVSIEFIINYRSVVQNYYNIVQFNHPWKVFSYYLYHRQVLGREDIRISFRDQTKFIRHSLDIGSTENYWVTKYILRKQFCGDFQTVDDAKVLFVKTMGLKSTSFGSVDRGLVAACYNIQQTDDPTGLKNRMKHFARTVLSGELMPMVLQKNFYEECQKHGYKLSYWFQGKAIKRFFEYGITIKNEMMGKSSIQLNHPHFGLQRYFNVEQVSDPLQVHRACSMNLTFLQPQVYYNFVTGKPLSLEDCIAIRKRQCFNHFISKDFIKEHDLGKVRATVKNDQEEKFLHLSYSRWYNLDQIENSHDLLKMGRNSVLQESSLDSLQRNGRYSIESGSDMYYF